MTGSQLACQLNWLERCTGIAEVKGSNPVQACFFFPGFLSQLQKSCVYNCDGLLYI